MMLPATRSKTAPTPIATETSILGRLCVIHFSCLGAVIPTQSGGGDQAFNFLASQREALIAAAVFYWIFTYTFSKASQRLEKRLGVGTR